jgi:carbon monoxide dehydrogenase subunit G
MARYKATVDTSLPPAEVFAYMSDFSTAAEWDPGTVESERLGDAPLGVGTKFRLVAEFLGRRSTLTYTILEYDEPKVVAFRGENSTVVSLDRIGFEAHDAGTRIVYDAQLTLKGPLKLADPLLALAFKRVGDQALTGLRETLAAQSIQPNPRGAT